MHALLVSLHTLKTKFLTYALIPVLGVSALSVGIASAHGTMIGGFGPFGSTATPEEIASRQTQVFTGQANLLGLSIDDVKQAWAEGKTTKELAATKGITDAQLQEKLQTARTARIEAQLKTLVDKGVITQAQADQRLAFMTKQTTDNAGRGGRGRGHGQGGRGGMMGF